MNNPHNKKIASKTQKASRHEDTNTSTGAFAPGFNPGQDALEETAADTASRAAQCATQQAVQRPCPASAPPTTQAAASSTRLTQFGTVAEDIFEPVEPPVDTDDEETTTNNKQKSNKDDCSRITKALRKHVEDSGEMPRVDKDGMVCVIKPGEVGSAAKKNAEVLTETEINEKHPAQPKITLPNPDLRAAKCKKGKFWTEETIDNAVDELLPPAGFCCILVSPEACDREELLKHPEFVKKDEHGNPTKGVMSPCICCGTNKFVQHKEFNVQKHAARPRVAFGVDGKLSAMVTPIFKCSNPECCGKKPEDVGKLSSWNRDSELKAAHTFNPTTKEAFAQHPKKICEKCGKHFSGIGVNDDGTMCADEALNLKLLDDRTDFEGLAEHLDMQFQLLRETTRSSHQDFVEKQKPGCAAGDNQDIRGFFGAAPPGQASTKWPAFDEEQFDRDFHPPKVDAIKNLFWIAFLLIEPHLLRDLKDRTPGRIIRWDATFDLISKTMADILSTEEIKALGIIWGECGHILSCAFLEGETALNWQRMMCGIRQRCESKGKEFVDAVVCGHSDLCCEGCKDPTKHWFVDIWPNVETAPRKDLFHAEKMATDMPVTAGPDHPLLTWFCRSLSGALLEFPEAERAKAIAACQKEKPGTTDALAWEQILRTKSWKKKMDNQTRSIREAAQQCRDAFEELKTGDDQLAREAELNGEHCTKHIKSQIKGKRRGTECEVENLAKHLEKGCCADPFPIHEMNCLAKPARKPKKGRLPDKHRLRGTSAGESTNKQVNNVGSHATHLSPELADAKVLLRVVRINRQKDTAVQHITGIPPKPLLWFIPEALDQQAVEIAHLKRSSMPVVHPSSIVSDEPIGLEFARSKCWSTIDGRIAVSEHGPLPRNEAEEAARLETVTESPEEATVSGGNSPTASASVAASPWFPASPSHGGSLGNDGDSPPPPFPDPDSAVSPPPPFPDAESAFSPPCPTRDAADPLTPEHEEVVQSVLDDADAAAAAVVVAPAPQPSPPRRRSAPEFCHGATTWNRKLGPAGAKTFASMRATLPFNEFQVHCFARFVREAVQSSGPNQTCNQLSKKVCDLWNDDHTRRTANLNTVGLIGFLHQDVARTHLKSMTTAAVASRGDFDFNSLVAFSAIGMPQQHAFVAPQQLDQQHGMPLAPQIEWVSRPTKKQKTMLKPINELTESDVGTLSMKDLRVCAKSIGMIQP